MSWQEPPLKRGWPHYKIITSQIKRLTRSDASEQTRRVDSSSSNKNESTRAFMIYSVLLNRNWNWNWNWNFKPLSRFLVSLFLPMADSYCADCKRLTEVVFDHSAGDTICSECGLVLEAYSVDETSEWRIFANESSDHDPVRVGGPLNPLLSGGGLSTVIAKPTAGGSTELLSGSLGKLQARSSHPDRNLIQAFKSISAMSDRCNSKFKSCIFLFLSIFFLFCIGWPPPLPFFQFFFP